jgi:hypothetical protein
LTAGRKADWDAFKKDFLEKAQKDFGNSNIKLQYTFTDGDDPQVTGTKSDSLNFGVSDHRPGNADATSTTNSKGLALSFIDIEGLGKGGIFDGPAASNKIFDSNAFEHELGQQFLGGTEKSHDPVEDFFRNERIDPSNTFQGWGARQSAYRERT